MQQFHHLPWESRGDVLERMEDWRLRELGYRIIHTEKPHALTTAKRQELDNWRRERCTSKDLVPWRTLSIALEEVKLLLAEDSENNELMREVRSWLETFDCIAPTNTRYRCERTKQEYGWLRPVPGKSRARFRVTNQGQSARRSRGWSATRSWRRRRVALAFLKCTPDVPGAVFGVHPSYLSR